MGTKKSRHLHDGTLTHFLTILKFVIPADADVNISPLIYCFLWINSDVESKI